MIKKIKAIISRYFPSFRYWHLYRRVFIKLVKNDASRRQASFKKLVSRFSDKRGLQIGVRRQKFSPIWVSVDLYDMSDYIDYHYDIMDLQFPDATFDVAICNAVL